MSLKMFHLMFITAAAVVAFGCGGLALKVYWSDGGGTIALLAGLGSIAAGVGLVLYERYFLKKMKDVGFL